MSDSNNITVLNPGLYKNLLAQVESIYRHSNELSFKTRARYFEATKRFCKFLADNFRLQNFKNVEDRHFRTCVEHLIESGAAPATIFWHGLRHGYAQKTHEEALKDNPRKAQKIVSENLGHHRYKVTRIYLAEAKSKKKTK